MRVFIGIAFDHEVKEYLHHVQQIVKRGTIKGDFTDLSNFHLTIKYIGQVTEDELDLLEDILDEVCQEITPFDLTINGLGSFEKKHSSIVYVGINEGKTSLQHLFSKIEYKTIQQGFDKEQRKYRPHITLGKKLVFSPYSHTEYIPSYTSTINVRAITLFLSERVEGVLTYTPLYQTTLKKEA